MHVYSCCIEWKKTESIPKMNAKLPTKYFNGHAHFMHFFNPSFKKEKDHKRKCTRTHTLLTFHFLVLSICTNVSIVHILSTNKKKQKKKVSDIIRLCYNTQTLSSNRGNEFRLSSYVFRLLNKRKRVKKHGEKNQKEKERRTRKENKRNLKAILTER